MPKHWFAAAFVAAGSASAFAAQDRLTLEEAIARALENNPEVHAAQADMEAAHATLGGVSRLLRFNPEAGIAAGPRFREDENTLDLGLELSQELEIAGQRGGRVGVAEAELGAAESRLAARKSAVRADVQVAFGQVLAAEALVDLATQARSLVGDASSAAEERFRVGETSRIEVNAARVEVGRSARDLTLAQRARAGALAELASLLALPAGEPLAVEGELGRRPPPDLTLAPLVSAAVKARPDLAAARQELAAAHAQVDLAEAEGFPNVRVGATYDREEGDQVIQGTLAIPLPLFDRNQGARGVAAARAGQAERALAAAERRIEREVRLAVTRYEAARSAAESFSEEALAALVENLGLVSEAFKAGKVDFLHVVLVRRETLEGRRAAIEVLEELNRAEAELGRALGRVR